METSGNKLQKKVCKVLSFYLYALLPLYLFFSPASLSAQTFTQRVQQQDVSGARIVIHQDAAIDELVNGKPVVTTTQRQNATSGQHATGQQARGNRSQQTEDRQIEANAGEQSTDTVPTLDNQRTRKVMGYRIQAFAGGKTRADRQKAEQTASALRSLFPGHKVYVHFYSPRWICRMGNFRTLAEAKEVLDEVVRMGYDTATLVRGKVTVPY